MRMLLDVQEKRRERSAKDPSHALSESGETKGFSRNVSRKKTPWVCHGVSGLNLAMTYFRMVEPTLSSALSGFTSEFEMDSGGSRTLLSPGNSLSDVHFGSEPENSHYWMG